MDVLDIMTTKITVTRALAEIKLLQKRIDSGVQNLAVVGYQQNNKMQSPNSHMEINAFEEKAKAGLASVEDLIARITLIKTAINKSNSTTIIKVAGREMTIEEALVEKQHILYKKSLLGSLKSQMNDVKRKFEACVTRVNDEIDDLRESLSSSKDADKDNIDEICKRTMELKYPKLVDPCDLTKKIETLEKDIEDFENNVDYALSESNSVTYIEV